MADRVAAHDRSPSSNSIKLDCEHIESENCVLDVGLGDIDWTNREAGSDERIRSESCTLCKEVAEIFVCLLCCSRACVACMKLHGKGKSILKGKHDAIALSLKTYKVNCFECDHCIMSEKLIPFFQMLCDSNTSLELLFGSCVGTDGDKKDSEEDKETDFLSKYLESLSLSRPEPPKAVTPISKLASQLKAKQFQSVVVLTGAGISTGSGIPDFRSANGIYANLKKYGVNLSNPADVFDIQFFRRDPKPFLAVAKSFYDGNYKPTPAHYLIYLLQESGCLRRLYTQNIDGLDSLAGVKDELIVECHGSFKTASCTKYRCRNFKEGKLSVAEVKDKILQGKPPLCPRCKSYGKPDIVFFGESLPSRFHELYKSDAMACDLFIVIGTSLSVNPVAKMPSLVRDNIPRVLINNEVNIGDFDRASDVLLQGDIQKLATELCELVGWKDKLTQLQEELK